MTNATICRGTPRASIASMARGRAASELVVAKAMGTGSVTARTNARKGTRNIIATGSSTVKRDVHAAVEVGRKLDVPFNERSDLRRSQSTDKEPKLENHILTRAGA